MHHGMQAAIAFAAAAEQRLQLVQHCSYRPTIYRFDPHTQKIGRFVFGAQDIQPVGELGYAQRKLVIPRAPIPAHRGMRALSAKAVILVSCTRKCAG